MTAGGPRATPLYERIYQQLLGQIDSGELAEGQQLPTELELAERFDVSRGTVRQAVTRLVFDGVVERTAGKGTFVSPRRLVYRARELLGFTEQIRASGRVPSSQVVDLSTVTATNNSHGIDFGETVPELLSIERVRLADGEAIALEHLLLPFPRFAGLREVELESRSIYDTLEELFGVQLTIGEFALDIAELTAPQAALLGEPTGSVAFAMSGVVRDQLGGPIVGVRSYYRRDKFSFTFAAPRESHAQLEYTQPRLVIAPLP